MSAVSPSNLLCYYTFEKSTSTQILNELTGLYDMNLNAGTGNTVSIVSTRSKVGSKSLYNSDTSHTSTSNYSNTTLPFTTIQNSISISIWFYNLSTYSPAYNRLVNLWSTSGNPFYLDVDNTNIRFGTYYVDLISTDVTVGLNTWNHFVLTGSYSGGTSTLIAYLNGTAIKNSQNNTTSYSYTGTLFLSSTLRYFNLFGSASGSAANAYIDEVCVFSSVLSPIDVTNLYNLNYTFGIQTKYYYGSNEIAYNFQPLNNNVNGVNQTTYLTSGSDKFNKIMLYAYGTRSGVGFNINNMDIGKYFQRDSITYANDLGNYASGPWGGAQGTKFQYARWIWNDPNAATNAAVNAYLWFYYTFYYSGETVTNNGTFYVSCDDFGSFYFNGNNIGSSTGGWGANSNGYAYNITIINGLNYIRVFAYNAGSAAGLLVALYEGSNHIVSSSSNWVVTTSTDMSVSGAAIFIAQ